MTFLSAAVAAAIVATPAMTPPRRVPSDEVRVPGTDIMLKANWSLQFVSGCRYAVPRSWQSE